MINWQNNPSLSFLSLSSLFLPLFHLSIKIPLPFTHHLFFSLHQLIITTSPSSPLSINQIQFHSSSLFLFDSHIFSLFSSCFLLSFFLHISLRFFSHFFPFLSFLPFFLSFLPDGKLTINEGPVVTVSDISTGNGVVHLLNGILFPPNLLLTFKQLEARTFFNRQPIMAEGRLSESRNPENRNPESRNLENRNPDNRFNRRATNSPVTNDLRGNANNQRNSQLAIRGIPGQIRPLLDDPMKPGQKLEATNTTRFYRWLQKSGFMDVLNNTRWLIRSLIN